MNIISVAIDGPSGAGKSTLARSMAGRFGFLYVDTGAIYRTIGLYAWEHQIDPKDAEAVTAALPEIREDGLQHMLLNGRDVTGEIRLPRSPCTPPPCRPIRRCGPIFWRCSASLPAPAASSWTAGTSAPWCCRTPR